MNEICINEEKKNPKFKKLNFRNVDIPFTAQGLFLTTTYLLVLAIQFALTFIAVKIAFTKYEKLEQVIMVFFAIYFTIPFLIIVGLMKALA